MNWIKKLFQFLHNDHQDEEYDYEYESNYQRNYSKHIETKVTYQYPKGKFRFPVIPDSKDQPTYTKPQRNRTTPIRTNEKKELNIKIERRNERNIAEKKLVERKIVEGNNQKPIVKENVPKEPFKPTEIPSPVYGFTRPKTDEVIEFELPTFGNEEKHSVKAQIVEEAKLEVAATSVATEEKETTESLDITDILQELKENNSNDTQVIEAKEDETISTKVDSPKQEVKKVDEEITDTKSEDHTLRVNQEKPSSERKEQPKRNHIPFNVLMFKKDKEKIKKAEAQKVQTIEQKELSQTSKKTSVEGGYVFPTLQMLHSPPFTKTEDTEWLNQQRTLLDQTLRNFKVRARVVNVTQGPAVTRFEVHPEPGVKVNKITNLSDDIKLSLAAKDIRIEAPIPGKNTIGIEVPNPKSKPVLLKEILKSAEFINNPSPLTVALGLDISGKPIVTDLKKMPHGLIAGATGSGKSVCINAMLVSLLYKAAPHQVKLLLIDPKMVELAPYNHIPHLVSPVITDVKAATVALKWAVEEMERRYELFAHSGVRDISKYNELVKKHDEKSGELPYIVIIIDELADLMMVAPGEVEEAICRIAQKARACGIHLILATQRPSVDVITGLIKANIPTRIAFSVSSQVDSRTIIDTNGADKLLGKGDMLFLENGSSKPVRVQGNFVSDEEIEQVVDSVKNQMKPSYLYEQEELIKRSSLSNEEDELFMEACEFVLEHGGASTSSLQRHFRIGYNRAARLIDMMEDQGIISGSRGSKPREVLVTEEEFANMQEQ